MAKLKIGRRQVYRSPRTQHDRLREAEQAIVRLQSTLNTGDNRFGMYGNNVRESLQRWEATANDARNKIARGITKL